MSETCIPLEAWKIAREIVHDCGGTKKQLEATFIMASCLSHALSTGDFSRAIGSLSALFDEVDNAITALDETQRASLIEEIEAFVRRTGIAESTFGLLAVNDGKLVRRLRGGGRMFRETEDRIRAFIASRTTEPTP